jgi:UDP-N-acetylmuramate dehydrogenase
VSAQAGAPLMEVVTRCVGWSLSGLEKLAGIPGSIGGAVVMNAGAHGAYMDAVVRAATILGADGRICEKTADELGFGYRRSGLGDGEVIVEVGLSLAPGDQREISQIVAEKLEWRRVRQPLSMPSAGSVFKNPPGTPAGRIIAELGLKGTAVGGAEVSELHGNFIVNRGGARAADVLSLVDLIVEKVRTEHNIELEPEIKIVGVDG